MVPTFERGFDESTEAPMHPPVIEEKMEKIPAGLVDGSWIGRAFPRFAVVN